MNEKNPFVFVVDDDASIRDSLRRSHRLGWTQRADICLGARVLDKPASGCPQLPGARCTAAGIEWS